MDNVETLIYWIEERYKIYKRREDGMEAPWSNDPVFQNTYFCNVHRENDRVTKAIRSMYDSKLRTPLPELNMMIARFVNKPSSLEAMGWPFYTWGEYQKDQFLAVMSQKGSWGGAYIVSTNGNPVPKHEYIAGLIEGAVVGCELVAGMRTLSSASLALQRITGLASFMSGQIVADLKNTKGHPLHEADDWWTFCTPGPGSLRGMAWTLEEGRCTPTEFAHCIPWLREYVDEELSSDVPPFCNQDLQNCLCEFDKYMRVKNGTGRSKRKYNATGVPDKRRKMKLNLTTAKPEEVKDGS